MAEILTMPRHRLYVQEVPGKGRGVFTAEPIPGGAVIEVAPVIAIPELGGTAFSADRTIDRYLFKFGDWMAVALGYGSLYNHSYEPNARYDPDVERLTITFVALRDIEANEEITTNYNRKVDDRSPLWFTVVP